MTDRNTLGTCDGDHFACKTLPHIRGTQCLSWVEAAHQEAPSTVEKVVRNGKVAVLYSPGYGAGWSSWACDEKDREEMVFDAALVGLIETKVEYDKVQAYCEQRWPDVYCGGLSTLKIQWVPQGEQFDIHEYDGSESVIIGKRAYTA